ncbi:hypothetical protein CDAR_436471, partial [Caerostris darwini]
MEYNLPVCAAEFPAHLQIREKQKCGAPENQVSKRGLQAERYQ